MPYHPQKRYLSYCAGKFFPFIYRMNGCWEMDTTGFEPVTDCLWGNCSSAELSVLRYQVPSPNFPWHCCGSYPHSHNKGSAAYFIAMFITGEVFRGFWHPFNQPRLWCPCNNITNGARGIWTHECSSQSAEPYHLAIALWWLPRKHQWGAYKNVIYSTSGLWYLRPYDVAEYWETLIHMPLLFSHGL